MQGITPLHIFGMSRRVVWWLPPSLPSLCDIYSSSLRLYSNLRVFLLCSTLGFHCIKSWSGSSVNPCTLSQHIFGIRFLGRCYFSFWDTYYSDRRVDRSPCCIRHSRWDHHMGCLSRCPLSPLNAFCCTWFRSSKECLDIDMESSSWSYLIQAS